MASSETPSRRRSTSAARSSPVRSSGGGTHPFEQRTESPLGLRIPPEGGRRRALGWKRGRARPARSSASHARGLLRRRAGGGAHTRPTGHRGEAGQRARAQGSTRVPDRGSRWRREFAPTEEGNPEHPRRRAHSSRNVLTRDHISTMVGSLARASNASPEAKNPGDWPRNAAVARCETQWGVARATRPQLRSLDGDSSAARAGDHERPRYP